MARKQENPNQIIRKDSRASFVEVLRSAYSIGKVQMNFIAYDKTQAAGNKYTSKVEVYFDFSTFFRISHDILSGKIFTKMQKAKGTPEGNITLYMGGKKDNGNVIARKLGIFTGNKPFIFVAEQGPGAETEKGLFAPKWGNQPSDKVTLPMTVEDVKELFLMVEKDIQAYLTFRQLLPYQTYTNDLLEAIAKATGADISAAKQKLEETLAPYKKREDNQQDNAYEDPRSNIQAHSYGKPIQQNGNTGYNTNAQPQRPASNNQNNGYNNGYGYSGNTYPANAAPAQNVSQGGYNEPSYGYGNYYSFG